MAPETAYWVVPYEGSLVHKAQEECCHFMGQVGVGGITDLINKFPDLKKVYIPRGKNAPYNLLPFPIVSNSSSGKEGKIITIKGNYGEIQVHIPVQQGR